MTSKFIITAFFAGVAVVSYAQPKVVQDAEKMYVSQNYCDAADKCALAYSKLQRKSKTAKKAKAEMAFKTAESYRLTERFREATEWYEKAIILEYYNVNPLVYYYNGEMYLVLNETDKARKNYEEYKKLAPEDTRGDVGLESVARRDSYVNTISTKLKVENESKINTKSFDMAPMFGDRKEMIMYFGSSRDNSTGTARDPRTCEKYMDIWISELDKNGNWKEPVLIDGEGINTEDNEGTVAFDGRGKTMFFTRCPNLKKHNLGCEIWVSESKGKNKWGTPKKLDLKPHDSLTVGHPAVSEDGRFLIFASDLPGGFGGLDLWSTTYDKKSDSWSTPKNLGSEINTSGNDVFPTFAKNGDLFYATDGKPGIGGLDIFRATKQGEENVWVNPVNMGSPINSANNDYALVEHTDRTGYFTSERKSANGENKPDIYKYEIPPYVFDLKVIVNDMNDKTTKIADAKVVVTASTGDKWEGYTNKQGVIFWDKKPTGDRYLNEDASYTINVSKEGYHDAAGSRVTTVGLKYDQNFVIDLALLPKKPIRLPEVRYALAKWDLLVDSTINSKDSLNFVYDLLNEYPGMVLELSSHTDSRGSNVANQVLSENRAHKCYEYLVKERGVDPRRIVPVGKGEGDPRYVFRKGDNFSANLPKDEEGNAQEGWVEVRLTEALINSYKAKDKALFEMLHQWNRRTEGRVITLDFNAETAPAAPASYLEFKKVPKM
ncbi:MAG: OmpA family protein [Crocinitomicaceae bacterium]|nr:OmpA family protein [Crocinitomicaceae bacterium]